MIGRNTYRAADLAPLERTRTVTVCVPARDEAKRIERTAAALVAARDCGIIDEVLVLGGDSHDDTDQRAMAVGATVCDVSTIRSDVGPVLGKGDAMWRALSVVTTDVVAYVDADLQVDIESLVCGLIGPLVTVSGAASPVGFVKGAFRRHHPDFITEEDPYDGGRVTETVARPLINLLRPDLAGFYQPLGGQVAGNVALLRSIPMLTGYAVEIAMLIDIVDRVGLPGVVEVDLGDLENRPRTTTELAPMAQEVLYGFLQRVCPDIAHNGWQPYARPRFSGGTDQGSGTVVERPPVDSVS